MLLPLKVILLDMDGVLAEVGRSYRTSIVETCRHFVGDGCTITPETVHQEKVKGGCNNDWVLSLCLIKRELGESGSASGAVQVPSLQEVTDKFEELYQGTGDVKGLYELETLIPERKVLEDLYQRTNGNIAIVTGRPRKDCEAFLKRFELSSFVKHCVCMEDCITVGDDGEEVKLFKPDKFPCLEALRLLGVSPSEYDAAAIVGDTPDDIVSGREAGIRSIGVLVPGDGGEGSKIKEAMLKEGAEVVLVAGLADLPGMVSDQSQKLEFDDSWMTETNPKNNSIGEETVDEVLLEEIAKREEKYS